MTGDGATVRDHALSAQQQWEKLGRPKRRVDAAVEGSAFPFELAYLWRWFAELALGLETGGFGPASVTWEGLSAWATFMGLDLRPWEALALVRLGNLRVRVLSEPKPKATS